MALIIPQEVFIRMAEQFLRHQLSISVIIPPGRTLNQAVIILPQPFIWDMIVQVIILLRTMPS